MLSQKARFVLWWRSPWIRWQNFSVTSVRVLKNFTDVLPAVFSFPKDSTNVGQSKFSCGWVHIVLSLFFSKELLGCGFVRCAALYREALTWCGSDHLVPQDWAPFNEFDKYNRECVSRVTGHVLWSVRMLIHAELTHFVSRDGLLGRLGSLLGSQ